MRYRVVPLSFFAGVCVLAGCATPYAPGQTALRQQRYGEAARHFEYLLARDPGRLDALLGLGVSRYKLEEFDAATSALQRVVAWAPAQEEARLYLGLSYLRMGEDGLATRELAALLALKPEPRFAAQLGRALGIIRSDQPLSRGMRGFLAASLENESEWAREARKWFEGGSPVIIPPS